MGKMFQNTSILQEISRRPINVSKNEEPFMVWHNSIITIRTDKGIQFFDFSYDVQCLDKKIDCIESVVLTPKVSSVQSLFTQRFIKRGMDNLEFTQMIVDSCLWPHNPILMNQVVNVKAFEWSSPGLIAGNECILAVLNNVGNIVLYRPHKNKWTSVFNLSSHIFEKINSEFPSKVGTGLPDNIEQLKEAVYLVVASACCWAPSIQNNSCFFVTAQKSKDLMFLCIQYKENELKVEFVSKIHIDTEEIVNMLWIPLTDNEFYLICSIVTGELMLIACQINKTEVKFAKKIILWKDTDRMVSKHLHYTFIENKLALIFNKHRHLVVQMLDEDGSIVSQAVKNVNDYRITDIIKTKTGFFLSTVNCRIYKIDFTFTTNNIAVQLHVIETKILNMSSTHELYSMSFSTNNVLCALILKDKKVLHRKSAIKVELVFLCDESQEKSNEALLLLKNPTKSLTNMWDCVELLRFKIMKSKVLPKLDYKKLYADDMYKLKVYLILLILYNKLESVIKNGSRGLLPETSIEKVKDKLFLLHAKNYFNELVDKTENGDMLSNIENETLANCKNYIKYYCNKYDKKISEFITTNKLNVIKSTYQYTCQCCDENIEQFSCKNGHLNMFCSLTFTPIENDNYLVCKSCGSTARIELENTHPTCLFCDLYFCNVYTPT